MSNERISEGPPALEGALVQPWYEEARWRAVAADGTALIWDDDPLAKLWQVSLPGQPFVRRLAAELAAYRERRDEGAILSDGAFEARLLRWAADELWEAEPRVTYAANAKMLAGILRDALLARRSATLAGGETPEELLARLEQRGDSISEQSGEDAGGEGAGGEGNE